jgi:hypothetical protein
MIGSGVELLMLDRGPVTMRLWTSKRRSESAATFPKQALRGSNSEEVMNVLVFYDGARMLDVRTLFQSCALC